MGAIVVSQPNTAADEIEVGDVITFNAMGPNGDPALITHRVVEVLGSGSGIRFRTQGDAVEDPDMTLVSSSNLSVGCGSAFPWPAIWSPSFAHRWVTWCLSDYPHY